MKTYMQIFLTALLMIMPKKRKKKKPNLEITQHLSTDE